MQVGGAEGSVGPGKLERRIAIQIEGVLQYSCEKEWWLRFPTSFWHSALRSASNWMWLQVTCIGQASNSVYIIVHLLHLRFLQATHSSYTQPAALRCGMSTNWQWPGCLRVIFGALMSCKSATSCCPSTRGLQFSWHRPCHRLFLPSRFMILPILIYSSYIGSCTSSVVLVVLKFFRFAGRNFLSMLHSNFPISWQNQNHTPQNHSNKFKPHTSWCAGVGLIESTFLSAIITIWARQSWLETLSLFLLPLTWSSWQTSHDGIEELNTLHATWDR